MRAGADSKQLRHPRRPHRQGGNGHRAAFSHCPYLGIIDDPATAFAFTTPANHCFRKQQSTKGARRNKTPQVIALHHQETFCLNDQYSACPLYQEAINGANREALDQTAQSMPVALGRLRKAMESTVLGSTVPVRSALASTLLGLLLIALLYVGIDGSNMLTGFAVGSDNDIVQNSLAEGPAAEQPLAVLDDDPTPTPSATTPPTATSVQSETTHLQAATGTSRPSSTPTTTATAVETPTSATADPDESSATPTAIATAPDATATPCVPPSGWVTYIVQHGENLYRIGLRHNLSVSAMMEANCLSSARVYAGQSLLVPFRIPINNASPTPPEPTATNEPPPPPPQDTPPPPPPTETQPPPPPTETQPPHPTATPLMDTPVPPSATPPPLPTSTPPLPSEDK